MRLSRGVPEGVWHAVVVVAILVFVFLVMWMQS